MNRNVSREPILYRSKTSSSLSWMVYWVKSRIGNMIRPRELPDDPTRTSEAPRRAEVASQEPCSQEVRATGFLQRRSILSGTLSPV